MEFSKDAPESPDVHCGVVGAGAAQHLRRLVPEGSRTRNAVASTSLPFHVEAGTTEVANLHTTPSAYQDVSRFQIPVNDANSKVVINRFMNE